MSEVPTIRLPMRVTIAIEPATHREQMMMLHELTPQGVVVGDSDPYGNTPPHLLKVRHFYPWHRVAHLAWGAD